MKRTNNSKVFIDPKEHLVNNEALERNNKQLQEKTNNTSEKRSPPSDDDDVIINSTESDGGKQMTPQGKKKSKTNNDLYFFNKNRNANIQHIQQQSTPMNDKNNDVLLGQSNVSNQAIAYAVENNLQAIKIECTPPLENRDLAKKFVINFLNFINKDFRKEYPGNTQPLGFHHWWTDTGGNKFFGVTNDTDLFIYLCDLNHYPTQINNIKLKPDPPKRLPPQNTIVIKFVPNELHKDEVKDELKHLYSSIFAVEDMMGTMRSKSRHIRVELYQKDDYIKITNNGKIGLQGQIFEIEEYLPPPKILICSKCNTPGHAKKACQSSVDICRRCGDDRNNGNKHIECSLICHHCGGNHMATDYKCPMIVKFRQELLFRLKNDRSKLPPNIKLFIPVDCRLNGDRNRFLISDNETELRNSIPSNPPLINPWTTLHHVNKELVNKNDIDKSISALVSELAEMKENFDKEREKIKNLYEAQIKSIKQGWLMIQQQVQAQNQCISLMSTMIKDNATAMNQIISTIITLGEAVKTKSFDDLDQNKIEMSQLMINSTLNHIKNLNDSYVKQEQNLSLIMNKQSMVFQSALESLLPSDNE